MIGTNVPEAMRASLPQDPPKRRDRDAALAELRREFRAIEAEAIARESEQSKVKRLERDAAIAKFRRDMYAAEAEPKRGHKT